MTPWLVHELRIRGLNTTCPNASHANAALKMQMNKTDQNDAEGLAQVMHTGRCRTVPGPIPSGSPWSRMAFHYFRDHPWSRLKPKLSPAATFLSKRGGR